MTINSQETPVINIGTGKYRQNEAKNISSDYNYRRINRSPRKPDDKISRRQFLKLVAVAGAGVAGLKIIESTNKLPQTSLELMQATKQAADSKGEAIIHEKDLTPVLKQACEIKVGFNGDFQYQGTGVLLAETETDFFYVTSRHIISESVLKADKDDRYFTDPFISIRTYEGGTAKFYKNKGEYKTYTLGEQSENPLVIIKVKKKGQTTQHLHPHKFEVPEYSNEALKPGEIFRTVSFPTGFQGEAFYSELIYDGMENKLVLNPSDIDKTTYKNPMIRAKGLVSNGSSGAIAINEQDKIVGVLEGNNRTTHTTYLTPIKSFLELFKSVMASQN